CPGSIIAYKDNLHSYKGLHLKYAVMGHVGRHGFYGSLLGLIRGRAITLDDAHVFCTPVQIKARIKEIVNHYDTYFTSFGFDFTVEL
ncbi:aminoacyl--tRNA ligase-related protein, partial [Streptobacillus moniliformis]|uniref:aminoacyl--tRNA ligase-related protein n=1 Tax=Streptobacillus moniliformis TaxID=34105 RepID=UPI000A566C28